MLKFNEKNEVITEENLTAILVGVQFNEDISYSMAELKGLAEAADIEVLGNAVQKLDRPNTATFVGSGKVEELKQLAENMEADMLIINNELTGMQLRNLEDQVQVKVIDRTILILDIFAKRAESREGKLQVELAQLKYRLPRLTGFGKSLSRLGGGIGTRGPGEKKLETDRRHIERRIDDIKEELESVKKVRTTQRGKREKNEIPVVALVGYTNSGKSALMNQFLKYTETKITQGKGQVGKDNETGLKTVEAKDMLFATLDTQHRRIEVEKGKEFILIDTVGFVSQLPHSLVEAFKATLEDVTSADLLLHVVDTTIEQSTFQIDVTDKVVKEIGAGDTDKIMVYNKSDKLESFPENNNDSKVFISAKTGQGMDALMDRLEKKIFGDRVRVSLLIPFTRGDLSSYVCENGKVYSTDYKAEGTLLDVELKLDDYRRLEEYVVI